MRKIVVATLDVLIPHFNDPEALLMSLESVEQQTWEGSLRVIVVDDGSHKDQLHQVEEIVQSSALDIKLIKSPENKGRPVTRNKLLDAADAPFLAWLDAGDVWYPNKIKTQFDCIYKLTLEGVDIDALWVTCHYDWKWEGRRRRKVSQITQGDQLRELYTGDKLRAYLWTLLGTRKAFEMAARFDERLPRLQDLDYFISFVRAGGKLVSPDTDDSLCCYFKSDIGRNAAEIRNCYTTIFDKHHASLLPMGPKFFKRVKSKADMVAARFAKNNSEHWLAIGFRLTAFTNDPKYALYRLKKSLTQG
ncbi:MAG: glycosyltransferase involved in cell wall biosynthesis [Celeribacter sp.]|jgi:glycosyltransferase involved in cell wall biosynthesis